MRDRGRNFLFIVPDQATMEAQKALVAMSPAGGMLNVDVLGFGRLSHRILEETGQEEIPVLDDTGMSLLIQKVASCAKDSLPVLGNRLDSAGMISEVKSALSEFMQYGIGPSDMEDMIDSCLGRGALKGKLRDLRTIYSLFEDYIEGHYIAREEKLDILCEAIPSSSIVPDSVIVFDGFTGFTPVQLKVIRSLMTRCSEMIVTLECSAGEDVRTPVTEDELFYLSHKTAVSLIEIAGDLGADVKPAEECTRRIPNKDIAFLEENLFRRKKIPAGSGFSGSVTISEMSDAESEVHHIGVMLSKILAREGYHYRDFAIVCGDIETYAPYFEKEFVLSGIPFYLDNVTGLKLNALSETVLAYLNICVEDYPAGSVVRLLRAGLTGISREDADLLDNYIRQTGVRGYAAWHREFTRTVRSRREDGEYLEKINEIRRNVIKLFEPFDEGERVRKTDSAAAYTERLYNALIAMNAPDKLREMKRAFEAGKDDLRCREYAVIWKEFVILFDKIHQLTGDEKMSLENYSEMIAAGIGEIRIPGIPVSVDRVMIGDIERSRLNNVKVLFFAGVNDGNIPSDTSGKGMISDLDREFLAEKGIELSPTPRQKMYIQRQYLYMNICKPSEELHLSYVRVRPDGKSVRPSYLIPLIKRILPYSADVRRPETEKVYERVSTRQDALYELSLMMRDYADSNGKTEQRGETFALYQAVGSSDGIRQTLTEAAYKKYLDIPLSEEAAGALYPGVLKGSVSSLETYAGCPYRYFLTFGLGIDQGDKYEIQSFDRGSLIHDIIRRFSDALRRDGLTWKTFTDEYASELIPVISAEAAGAYGSSLYYDNKRNEYSIYRLSRLVINSACFLRDQLSAGGFDIAGAEKPYRMEFSLDKGRKLLMTGVIDRVDVAKGEKGSYVQIMDFKSGGKDIDISRLMDGRQIQLPLYMYSEKKEPGAIPASMLYFQIQDPMYDLEDPDDLEKAKDELRKKMRPKGEMLGEEEALGLLDRSLKGLGPQASSEYFNVGIRKEGGFTSTSRILDEETMEMLLDEAVEVAEKEAAEIMDGRISVSPYRGTCKYCPYLSACGMDRKIPGYSFRKDDGMKRADAIAALRAKHEDDKGDEADKAGESDKAGEPEEGEE